MAANVYECMFLLDTNKVAGDIPAAGKQLQELLERNQAEILASRPWDDRKLAYPIKTYKKGLYYLTFFRTEGKNLAKIEHDISLNEMVIRSLMLYVDPKHVEAMLAMARDEHAVALQTVNEPPPDDDMMGVPPEGLERAGGGGGPRRGGGGRRRDEMKD
jgi:small subunit ribosomal protein S6